MRVRLGELLERQPWITALLLIAVAFFVRLSLDPYLNDQFPFFSFYIAVAVAAYVARPSATLLVVAVGCLSSTWFFVEPRHTLSFRSGTDVAGVVIYLAVTGAITGMSFRASKQKARAMKVARELADHKARLEREIREREQAQQALRYQSEVASELLGARDADAVFDLITRRIRQVAGDAIVAGSEFDPKMSTIIVRRVLCTNEQRSVFRRLFGRDPEGLTLGLSAETRSRWRPGGLEPLAGGLHELVFGQLPASACEQSERELGVTAVFAMACAYEEDILGTVALMSREPLPLRNQKLIEALITQSGLALKRNRADQARSAAEERLRIAQELSLDGFTILDAVRDVSGRIVDFRWSFVNAEACRILKHRPEELLGKRLLQVLPGNRDNTNLFDRYAQVVETGEPNDCELSYEADGIHGWFRNMTVKTGDGIAVSFTDISERKRTEQALRTANEKLVDADRGKSEFLAILSHELRNPLAPITNSLYILQHSPAGGDKARRALAVIGRQVGQLSRLVDDLLEATRITRNKVQLQKQMLELNELVLRTVEDHLPQFESSGVLLELHAAPQPVYVEGDKNRLAQIIGNLLGNAAKFTEEGGRASVRVEVDDSASMAVVRVVDTGIGMTPEVQQRLFQPFMQADLSLDRSKGGLGLGLALVKGLVALHRGDIAVRSDGPGKGTEVVVRLPLHQGATEQPVSAPPSAAPSTRTRVLIVEDNLDAAESLKEVLELEAHEVTVAHDGPKGIALVRELHPDVVLCDIGLPGMDGYDVARAIRADPELRGTCLVALSGYALPEDLQRSKEAGFDHHLAKPPSIERLEELLRRASGASASSR